MNEKRKNAYTQRSTHGFGNQENKGRPQKKAEIPEAVLEKVRERQRKVCYLLYAAMILKAIATFFPIFEFPSSVPLLIFMICEIFLLPPQGMAVMCILVGVIFFFLQNVVQFLLGLMIGAAIFSVVAIGICELLSGIIFTFFCGLLVSIEVIVVTGPATVALTVMGATAGIIGAVAAGLWAAISGAGGSAQRAAGLRLLRTLLGSLLVFLVIGWPFLSYTQAFKGGIACKPAVILGQAHLNYFNYNANQDYKECFEDEEKWTFCSGFYSDYINNGRSNLIQGGKNMAAGDGKRLAILLDGLLYVQSKDIDRMDRGAGYLPDRTDALILTEGTTYIFGRNRIFCAGKSGNYTWKKTKWTSEFEALSEEEQFERVYDILERQNTEEKLRFSYEEVGVVAYAQRNGLLLDYEGETHRAWFASEDGSGEVTVWLQSEAGKREKQVTFTPECSGEGLPYVMVDGEGILYLAGNQVWFLSEKNDWKPHNRFTNSDCDGEKHDFSAISYMDLGEEGKYLVYLDEKDKIFVDTALIGGKTIESGPFKSDKSGILASAGNYVYSIQYENNLLSRLTYLPDIFSFYFQKLETSGWGFSDIWMENWSYSRMGLKKSLFIDETDEAEKEAGETVEETAEETDPASLYPAPETKARRDSSKPYDKAYLVAAPYTTWTGPQPYFYFSYPPTLYDNVDYRFENDGEDIDIVFTRGDDGSYLEVSCHPLPEGVEDLKAYAKSLEEQEIAALYNGQEANFKEYQDYDGLCRFRVHGFSEKGGGLKCWVMCHVDSKYVMRMVLRYPVGTDDEDKKIKTFYMKQINHKCGFGIPTKAPTFGSIVQ